MSLIHPPKSQYRVEEHDPGHDNHILKRWIQEPARRLRAAGLLRLSGRDRRAPRSDGRLHPRLSALRAPLPAAGGKDPQSDPADRGHASVLSLRHALVRLRLFLRRQRDRLRRGTDALRGALSSARRDQDAAGLRAHTAGEKSREAVRRHKKSNAWKALLFLSFFIPHPGRSAPRRSCRDCPADS